MDTEDRLTRLEKLAGLLERGALSSEEYAEEKRKLLERKNPTNASDLVDQVCSADDVHNSASPEPILVECESDRIVQDTVAKPPTLQSDLSADDPSGPPSVVWNRNSKNQQDILILQTGIEEAFALAHDALRTCGFKWIKFDEDARELSAKVWKLKAWGSVDLFLSERGATETEVIVNSSARTDNLIAAMNDPNDAIFRWIVSALQQSSSSIIIEGQDGKSVRKTDSSFPSEAENQNRKRLKLEAFLLAGAASIGIFFAMAGGQPAASEINLSDYEGICRGERYEDECEGKFVIWEGAIRNVESDYVRVVFPQVTMDVQGFDGEGYGFVSGQKVRVSGWLADKNFMYPDIEEGEIAALESAEAALARLEREEEEYAHAARSRGATDYVGGLAESGALDGMTSTLRECEQFSFNQEAYGECLAGGRVRNGW